MENLSPLEMAACRGLLEELWEAMNSGNPRHSLPGIVRAGIPAGAVALSLLWAYWTTLVDMERTWSRSEVFSRLSCSSVCSHLLWTRRHERPERPHGHWAGLILIATACAVRFAGTYFFFTWFDAISLLPWIAGLCLLVGGWPMLRWALPSIAFLSFMVPLPYRAEAVLGAPLQRLTTVSSTYVLQLCGLPAFSSGNTIVIDDYTIGIVDACNGLGAAYTVLACAFGAVLITGRPWLDQVILILSAIPIARDQRGARDPDRIAP